MGQLNKTTAEVNDCLSGKYRDISFNPVTPPVGLTLAINPTAGNLNGNYYYGVTFYTADGESETGSITSVISPVNQQVNLSNIPISTDVRVIGRKIYRNPANSADQVQRQLVATIEDNVTTTYTDNVADISLGVAIPFINSTGGAIFSNDKQILTVSNYALVFGINAMLNKTGYANTAIGINCLTSNTIGLRNTAAGMFSMYNNTIGSRNSAFGVHALNDNVIGSDCCAFGYGSLMHSLAINNSAFGANALNTNSSGDSNSAFGASAMSLNSTGSNCCAFGYYAMNANTSGAGNSAFGHSALRANKTSHNNTAFGFNCSPKIIYGGNCVFGAYSLANATTSQEVTAFGQMAFYNLISGNNGVAIGNKAGYYETAGNKLFIDNAPRASEKDGRIKALIYGVFDADTANQQLSFNAAKIFMSYLPTASAGLTSGQIWNDAGTLKIIA